jgi:hypothetical protein
MKKIVFILLIIHCTLEIDNCSAQWTQVGPSGGYILCFATSGTNLFAGSFSGIYKSTDNGTSWIAANNGLSNLNVKSIVVSGGNIFTGTSGGVFISTDDAASWTPVNNGLTNQDVFCIAISGSNMFAGTGGNGVYLSTNNGQNWNTVNTGLTNQIIKCLAISGTKLFAGTGGNGVYLSTNNGTSWSEAGLTYLYVHSLQVSGSNLFAGMEGAGVQLTTNNGTNWSPAGLAYQYVYSMTISGTNFFAGTGVNGVCLSTNNGQNWTQVNQGFGTLPAIYSLLIANNYIFAGTDGHSIWRRSYSDFVGVKNISSNIPDKFSLSQNYPNPFNPTTIIRFSVPENGKWKMENNFVSLKIYDIIGKEVTTLINEKLQPGTYEVPFSIDQFSSYQLPSGVYFYKLTADDYSETKKMTLIR